MILETVIHGKWKKSILNLRSELDKRGLNDIEIVGPDGGYWGLMFGSIRH